MRQNPKISGTKHNVFGIQAGVAIVFFVKDRTQPKQHSCRIHYTALADEITKDDKLKILSGAKIEVLDLKRLAPEPDGTWLNTDTSDFTSLLPLEGGLDETVFALASNGVVSNRDDWVYDMDANSLLKKAKYLSGEYNRLLKEHDASFPSTIKWSESLKSKFKAGQKSKFVREYIVASLYRPFTVLPFYSEKIFSDRLTDNHYRIFGADLDKPNMVIAVHSVAASFQLSTLIAAKPFDLGYLKQGNGGTFGFPLYQYDNGERHDNITDWSLRQFQEHYADATIVKRDLFDYTYAVLHHPAYRAKYEINLKREFPRLPFYDDFRQWAAWGSSLMAQHLDYEQAAPFPFERHDAPTEPARRQSDLLPDERLAPSRLLEDKPALRPRLKALKESGTIEIDAVTTLRGIPPAAWTYKLGNRSALEWVLDQWKEHKISDPTVAEKFNTYRFAPHKEQIITLLARVCTVSVATMNIVQAMPS